MTTYCMGGAFESMPASRSLANRAFMLTDLLGHVTKSHTVDYITTSMFRLSWCSKGIERWGTASSEGIRNSHLAWALDYT